MEKLMKNMKKLIFTVALLICGSNMAYGMDIVEAINQADWLQVINILKGDPTQGNLNGLLNTPDNTLSKESSKGLFLLPTLMYNCDYSNDLDGCALALRVLLLEQKLILTARDSHGNLLCNDNILEDAHKQGLIALLTRREIDNPFTQKVDPVYGITFQLKAEHVAAPPLSKSHSILTYATNYKLWLAAAALTVAAVGIYKWCTKKDADEDDEDVEQAELF
jgi:hypothetical protein